VLDEMNEIQINEFCIFDDCCEMKFLSRTIGSFCSDVIAQRITVGRS